MTTFAVKNFEKFQHYKDRNPPWIKLYYELLDDYAFGGLPDASKAHLLAIWLLASRYQNAIPYDPAWVARRINATEPVNLKLLAEAGFIVPDQACSKLLAKRLQDASPETETYREETEKKDSSSSDDDGLLKAFVSIWSKWPRKVGKGAAVKAYGKALRRAKHEEIAAGVDRALPSLSPDPQFIPHLATWLNQDRWLDEAASPMAADPEGNQLRQQAKLLATLTPFAKSQAQKLPTGAIPKMVRLGLLPADIAAEYGVKS